MNGMSVSLSLPFSTVSVRVMVSDRIVILRLDDHLITCRAMLPSPNFPPLRNVNRPVSRRVPMRSASKAIQVSPAGDKMIRLL
jgi:hypothetical protein